ncbi:MAG: hypothetical protein ACR2I0_10180 [Rhodoferax sp.]
MRIIFHHAFHASNYSGDEYDNAAAEGRMVNLMASLRDLGRYEIDDASPASRADLLRGHSESHVAAVEHGRPALFAMASLAVGATLLASDRAMGGIPSFACVRPPGHHASRNQAWGHCTFSNVALALLRLREMGQIRSALVVDFDLHTGDGTKDVLRGWPEAQVYNTYGDTAAQLLQNLAVYLQSAPQVDILAVSAGFDAYLHDLGGKLGTEDFFSIGRLLQGYAIGLGHQRRFAALEGGYYLPDLGKNALAFCRGFE